MLALHARKFYNLFKIASIAACMQRIPQRVMEGIDLGGSTLTNHLGRNSLELTVTTIVIRGSIDRRINGWALIVIVHSSTSAGTPERIDVWTLRRVDDQHLVAGIGGRTVDNMSEMVDYKSLKPTASHIRWFLLYTLLNHRML